MVDENQKDDNMSYRYTLGDTIAAFTLGIALGMVGALVLISLIPQGS